MKRSSNGARLALRHGSLEHGLEQHSEEWQILEQVSSPQAARFFCQAPQPFQAVALHPQGSARNQATDEAEGYADSDGKGYAGAWGEVAHPLFLLGSA